MSLTTALTELADKHSLRLHMPGHKGKNPFPHLDFFALDFTETYETGNLYGGEEPILSAEKALAEVYDATDFFFVTGGSSQSLRAAVAAVLSSGDPILCDRNCHKALLSAMVLLDLRPSFLIPHVLDGFQIPTCIDLTQLEQALEGQKALVITSPNYYGINQPIEQIAALCKEKGVVFIVDAAHGAHYPLFGLPSAVALGADIACLSAHKTLAALGQSAMLLSSGSISATALRRALALFGSSSPSYALLASTEQAILAMTPQVGADLLAQIAALTKAIDETTPFLRLTQDSSYPLDPARLVLRCSHLGITGHELGQILWQEHTIAVEMTDENNIVSICTAADSRQEYASFVAALEAIGRGLQGKSLASPLPQWPVPQAALSPRVAYFAEKITIALEMAEGRICGEAVIPYPPGVPVLYPGEIITKKHIEMIRNFCYNKDSRIQVLLQG